MTTTEYEIVKIGRKFVIDGMIFLSKREALGWIARAEANAAKDAYWASEERTARLEAAQAYLTKRASRPARAVQLTLFA
jgi:hypothetical protein